MNLGEYIEKQDESRRELLTSLHALIVKTNKHAQPRVGKMMGAEMIIYEQDGFMLYALGSGKQHISLHALPMYASKPIHEKYSALLSKAKVQKGCINFKNAEQMPLNIAKQFLTECSALDCPKLKAIFKKK